MDVFGTSNLTGGINYSLSTDRFGRDSSALDLNAGYRQVKRGIYFNNDFTVTFWGYLRAQSDWARVLDFGNGAPDNNVIISFCFYANSIMSIEVYNQNQRTGYLTSTENLELNKWYFICVRLSGTNLSIYLNGVLRGTLQGSYRPIIVTRENNYIGKSNWNGDKNVNAKIDDLKIFRNALSVKDISNEMNSCYFD